MKNCVSLSRRLAMLLEMLPACECLADIGTDHGYMPIAACSSGKAKRAVAADLRPGPLAIAARNVREAGLEARIDLRLGNGLTVLEPGEAELILISGMGGLLIRDILEACPQVTASARGLLLSPHSEAEQLRAWLSARGFGPVRECALVEDDKYYTAFLVCRDSAPGDWIATGQPAQTPDGPRAAGTQGQALPACWSEEEYAWGSPRLLAGNPALLHQLERRRDECEKLLSHLACNEESERCRQRMQQLGQELEKLKKWEAIYAGT